MALNISDWKLSQSFDEPNCWSPEEGQNSSNLSANKPSGSPESWSDQIFEAFSAANSHQNLNVQGISPFQNPEQDSPRHPCCKPRRAVPTQISSRAPQKLISSRFWLSSFGSLTSNCQSATRLLYIHHKSPSKKHWKTLGCCRLELLRWEMLRKLIFHQFFCYFPTFFASFSLPLPPPGLIHFITFGSFSLVIFHPRLRQHVKEMLIKEKKSSLGRKGQRARSRMKISAEAGIVLRRNYELWMFKQSNNSLGNHGEAWPRRRQAAKVLFMRKVRPFTARGNLFRFGLKNK